VYIIRIITVSVMKCPFCRSNTSVEISRPSRKLFSVWRRRLCSKCKKPFSTREKPDLSLIVTVTKNSSRHETFSDDKLFISIYECLSHRKDALEASRALSETIVRLVLPSQSGSVDSTEIKNTAMKVLRRFDSAAFTFYKAHHK